MRRSWSYSAIEDLASRRIAEYGARFSPLVGPPTPIDLVIERLFDLVLCWDDMRVNGRTVFAGLRPEAREIVLNERVDLLRSNRGFLRFTLGHELGHWELHVDHALLDGGRLFEAFPASIFLRCEASHGPIWVARSDLSQDGADSVPTDTPRMAREVNRYAAAVLIPRDWLVEAVRAYGVLTRTAVSDLAERFEVSFEAMRVRLEELGIAYVGKDGRVYRSRAEAGGQLNLLS